MTPRESRKLGREVVMPKTQTVILRSSVVEHATKNLSFDLTERFFGPRPRMRALRMTLSTYQVLSFNSSWICSFGTGSLSMCSFNHPEKSFSIGSVQRWSISPGV